MFNPFLPTNALGLAGNSVSSGNASGFINEPLVQVDYVRSNYVIPWLATVLGLVQWQQDADLAPAPGRASGATGKPFSSADVVFTL